MRVYFEKPRTVIGWKGLINDPHLDGSFRSTKGCARPPAAGRLAELGLPAGTEFLDTDLRQFYADLVSWGAIGARTAESQVHRELASGCRCPWASRTAPTATSRSRSTRSAPRAAAPVPLADKRARRRSRDHGQPRLPSGAARRQRTGPNYDAEHVGQARRDARAAGLPERLMVDCSHANSEKAARETSRGGRIPHTADRRRRDRHPRADGGEPSKGVDAKT